MKNIIRLFIFLHLSTAEFIRPDFSNEELNFFDLQIAAEKEERSLNSLEKKLFKNQSYEKTINADRFIKALLASYDLKINFKVRKILSEKNIKIRFEKLVQEITQQVGQERGRIYSETYLKEINLAVGQFYEQSKNEQMLMDDQLVFQIKENIKTARANLIKLRAEKLKS